MKKQQIWEVKTSDGVTRFYADKVEAEFAYKDAEQCGFGVRMAPIPMPADPKAFASLMQSYWDEVRGVVLAARRLADKRAGFEE
jgi:hypothetical protein